jgi:hypothetical protein
MLAARFVSQEMAVQGESHFQPNRAKRQPDIISKLKRTPLSALTKGERAD